MSGSEVERWRLYAAWYRGDLSCETDPDGQLAPSTESRWPSARYRQLFETTRRQILAPTGKLLTEADLEAAADELFAELSQVTPTDALAAQELERAAAAFLEVKRLLRDRDG